MSIRTAGTPKSALTKRERLLLFAKGTMKTFQRRRKRDADEHERTAEGRNNPCSKADNQVDAERPAKLLAANTQLPVLQQPAGPTFSSQHGIAQPRKQHRLVQACLDLGQKSFLPTRCSLCGMLYHKGNPQDEKHHQEMHQGFSRGIKHQGWAQERVLHDEGPQGRIIMVLPTDSTSHIKKALEVVSHVEQYLGLTAGWLLPSFSTHTSTNRMAQGALLHIIPGHGVTGVCVVEQLGAGTRVWQACEQDGASGGALSIPGNASSSQETCVVSDGTAAGVCGVGVLFQGDESGAVDDSQPVAAGPAPQQQQHAPGPKAVCGIRAVWVAQDMRRRKCATKLLDAARVHLVASYVVPKSAVAFASGMSTDGMALAAAYTGRRFFVYES